MGTLHPLAAVARANLVLALVLAYFTSPFTGAFVSTWVLSPVWFVVSAVMFGRRCYRMRKKSAPCTGLWKMVDDHVSDRPLVNPDGSVGTEIERDVASIGVDARNVGGTRYARRVVAMLKAKFPTTPAMRYSVANCTIVDQEAYRMMTEHGVRPAHIAVLKPMIVSLFFIPTRAEIEARQILADTGALDRLEEGNTRWNESSWFMDALAIIGIDIRRKAPEMAAK